MKRVVITGIGIICPSGSGAREFWHHNTAGTTFVRHEPAMARLGMKGSSHAPIQDFDLAAHHTEDDVRTLSQLSRFVQLSVSAGAMAARDGGLEGATFRPERAGVVFSSAIGGTPEFQVAYEQYSNDGTQPLVPFPEAHPFYDSVFLNYAPSWLSERYKLHGPCSTLTTGCTAGIDALGLAFDQVRWGDADIVLAASGEAPLSGLAYATLDVIGSLAVVNGPPETASRPFDARRGGFVLGEAAAALVVEEYEHAVARGATVYAEVLGFSSANNAFHMSDLASDGAAMATVLSGALDDAQVSPEDIDYVNAHGSSTPQNDVFETQALKTALGQAHAARTPISSTKSMIGHSLSSASMVGVIATIGALRHSVVPPTANYEVPDPACDLDYVPNKPRVHDARTALVSASGFGGIHSCAVLRRSDQDRPARLPSAAPGEGSAAPTAPTRRSLPVTASTTLVRGTASAETPTLLLIHGFGGTAAHWEPLMGALPPRFHAVALDLPGHGTHRMPVDTPLSAVRACLVDALERLGVTGPVVPVGHSLGGLVALDLAGAEPDRVRGAAVIGSAERIRLHPDLVAQALSGSWDRAFLAGCLRRPDHPLRAGRTTVEVVADGFDALRLPRADIDVWGLTGGLRSPLPQAPVLSLIAGADRVVSPRRSRALAHAAPRGSALTIEHADHYVHLEDPDRVAAMLAEYVAGLAASGGRP
ncbi:alpha/beta fold hydrolase [Streptomyces sp. BHT-5-2]|uniref:alpha/beta fold hydrolase n=1 Tax=Streptomyces sp. BHT-5-2 TaxID=2866715 RepID=UPI001C8E102A|nr:alpha/beta fold hydrolase [Streptomyces sp. BHT-5-2]QZL06392.1 alpha/beta fold hydrolase [Streptomyces sp. BHT-5-2]